MATGLWRGELARRFPRANSLRYLAPPALVVALGVGTLAGIGGIVGAVLGAPLAWALLGFAVPAGYLLLVVGAAVAAPRRVGAAGRCWLLVVLPTIHVGWGLGFLAGALSLTDDITAHTGR